MTHPETQHSHSRLKISKFWDKKTLPTTILQRFLLLQFVYSQDILSELAGYGPKGMFFLIIFFFCCIFTWPGEFEQRLKNLL